MSPKCYIYTVFEPLQGWGLHHCPEQLGPTPDRSCRKEIFPNIQSEPPLVQLEAVNLLQLSGFTREPRTAFLKISSPAAGSRTSLFEPSSSAQRDGPVPLEGERSGEQSPPHLPGHQRGRTGEKHFARLCREQKESPWKDEPRRRSSWSMA